MSTLRIAAGSRPLWLILAVAAAFRVITLFALPSIHYPDEVYQVLEQAHRLAFGYGVTPWEFSDGVRSMVLPYLYAQVFAASAPVFGSPDGYIAVARLLTAAFSLIPVAAIYRMGARVSVTHGVLAGLVAATWFEMVYFAPRPMPEVLAADALLTGLALATAPAAMFGFGRLAAIGLCIGASLMLRIHLAPGLAVFALWVGGVDVRRRWLPMICGGLIPVVVFGAVDWATWGMPFHSFIQSIRINLLDGKASTFGISSPAFVLDQMIRKWGGAFPLLIALVCIGARRMNLWVAVALTIIVTHSLIPHKEYRFFYPAIAALVIVAAMGSAELIEKLRARETFPAAKPLTLIAAVLWILTSVSLAATPGFVQEWAKQRKLIHAMSWLAREPSLCGMMVYDYKWSETPGYAFLHRKVPIYSVGLDAEAARNATAAYNYILLSRASMPDFSPQYDVAYCSGGGQADVCVMRRAGTCSTDGAMKAWLDFDRLGDPTFDFTTPQPFDRLSRPSAHELGPQ